MFALLLPSLAFLFFDISIVWIRQIIYKINFNLQPNKNRFLTFIFLTTIRIFASFPQFVYTLSIQFIF